MLVGRARAVAAEWVRRHARGRADYRGAFFSGSAPGLAEDAELAPTSDVDVMVVVAGTEAPPKLGKFEYEGVLLEVTYLAEAELADAERVALAYHLAHCLARDTIIDDPTGWLGELQRAIAPAFRTPLAVRRRCENVFAKIEKGLSTIDMAAPWHDQVTQWLFPTSVTAHVVLVAACRNPTVRLRYPAARGVLREYGLMELYPPLLGLIGCGGASREQVQRHLDTLASTFDAAAAVGRTRFVFSSDISAAARPIAIDGSQKLIDAGDHREAVFWMIATYGRCMKILAADAPERGEESAAGFRAAAGELLGVREIADLRAGAARVREFLPRLRAAAGVIGGWR